MTHPAALSDLEPHDVTDAMSELLSTPTTAVVRGRSARGEVEEETDEP